MSAGIKAIEFYLLSLRQEYERIVLGRKDLSIESMLALDKLKKEMIECESDLKILKQLETN